MKDLDYSNCTPNFPSDDSLLTDSQSDVPYKCLTIMNKSRSGLHNRVSRNILIQERRFDERSVEQEYSDASVC